jgi:hypothetical protein
MKLNARECKPQGNFPGACYNTRNEWKEEEIHYPTSGEALGVLYDQMWAA